MKLHLSLNGGPHTSTYIWGSSVGRMFWIWAGRPSRHDLFFSRSKICFSHPQCPERLWGPPSLLFNRDQEMFAREKIDRTWILTLTSI